MFFHKACWSALCKMAHRLKTRQGKRLYALQKQTAELVVFGIIKSVTGFRQFLLRGLSSAKGERSLVAMSWNILRVFALDPGLRRRTKPSRACFEPQLAYPAGIAMIQPVTATFNRSTGSSSPTGC
jgi:hypothetical protein